VGFVSITKSIDTKTPLGTARGAVAQLKRDLIANRIRNGMANAREKSARIGRLKTRDSDLIRKFTVSKCSAGAVSAELRAKKAEKAKVQTPEPTTGEVTPIEVSDTESSSLYEIVMPYNEKAGWRFWVSFRPIFICNLKRETF
jgi:hypothetical protein